MKLRLVRFGSIEGDGREYEHDIVIDGEDYDDALRGCRCCTWSARATSPTPCRHRAVPRVLEVCRVPDGGADREVRWHPAAHQQALASARGKHHALAAGSRFATPRSSGDGGTQLGHADALRPNAAAN